MVQVPRRCSHVRALVSLLPLGALLLGLAAGCGPSDPLEEIRQRQASGDAEGTIEPLRELLEERPDDPEVSYLYGRALVLTGWPSLALWPLTEAMEHPDWLVPAGMQLAHAALVTGDFNEVVEVTSRILEEHPEEAQALLLRAQAQAHWKRDAEAALADAERVLELQPELIEAYEPRILALLALQRREEASEVLAEAGRRLEETDAPESVLAWHCSTTGIFASEDGKAELARETWERCTEEYPGDPTVVQNAVAFYDAHREFERSLEVLRAAFEADPEQRAFRNGLADRLRMMGEPEEGEALLVEATEVDAPRLAMAAWSDLARYRHALGEHAAAADALERAVEQMNRAEAEPLPQLLFQYADALVVAGRHERALEVAEEIPVAAQRQLIRGRVAQEQGDPAKALEHFDEALRVWPDNTVARYYAALAAEKLGDLDRALEEYRYAIRIDAGATDARTRAAKLLIAEQQFSRAYQLLFLEVEKYPLEPEGEALGMFLMARVANPKQLQNALRELAARDPRRVPAALARGAEGAAERAGPAAALDLLATAPIDYSAPPAAPALRALVRYAHAAGDPAPAERELDAALAAHPESVAIQELRGLHLELAGDAAAAREAYERALELEARRPDALAGLARLALADDPARAAELFDRAAEADPTDWTAKLGAARALAAAGEVAQAAARLDAILAAHPLAGEAAAERVSLDLAQGEVTTATLERARRAVRLGGGVLAYERLSEVLARLDRPEQAEEAARRAALLRERRAKAASGAATEEEAGAEGDGSGEPSAPPASGG